MDFTNLHFTR